MAVGAFPAATVSLHQIPSHKQNLPRWFELTRQIEEQMKKPIQETIEIPADLSKPVVTTVEALKDADLSTIPEGLRLHIVLSDRTIELLLEGEWLRVRTFAQFDYDDEHGVCGFKQMAEVAFHHAWGCLRDESPNAKEQRWLVTPLSAMSFDPNQEIEIIVETAKRGLEDTVAAQAKWLLGEAVSQMKFKHIPPRELQFARK